MGITRGRSVNPKLKIGICGEHGGESESVKFCPRAGMTYVSCSPFRVPIAKLAAAQEAAADATRKPAAKPKAKAAAPAKKKAAKAKPKAKAAKKTKRRGR